MVKEGFPGGSEVKSLPATQEVWVQALGGEGPLEKGMANHSSILAWRLPPVCVPLGDGVSPCSPWPQLGYADVSLSHSEGS